MVYHSYDELIDMSFMAPQIQTLMEVMENGGRFFTVSPTLVVYLEKKYQDSVTEEHRTKVDGGFEYGDAVAVTDYALTAEQISKIQSLLPYAKINNYPELNFAVIKN